MKSIWKAVLGIFFFLAHIGRQVSGMTKDDSDELAIEGGSDESS